MELPGMITLDANDHRKLIDSLKHLPELSTERGRRTLLESNRRDSSSMMTNMHERFRRSTRLALRA
jgi:hypothetical protein